MSNIKLISFSIIICITIIYSFIKKFDISGGGASADLLSHWTYILLLNENIYNLFTLKAGDDYRLLHFPLHHLIFSRFDFLINNQKLYLSFFFFFSLLLPILFYLNCKILYKNDYKNNLIFISILIVLMPHYQASAIWGNSHITALIFFLLSVLFFNIRFNNNVFLDKKNIFFSMLFLTMAAYTRQYYVIFFPFMLLKIYQINRFKEVFFIILVLSLLALPGLSYLINNPKLLTGFKMNITDFKSSILIVISLICFYLLPFFILNLKENIKIFCNEKLNKKKLYVYLILNFFLLWICFNFNYEGLIGGGIFYKISLFFLNNNFILYISSFIGLFLIYFYYNDKFDYILLIFLLTTSFSSGFFIFQKYFEPLLIFILFLFFDKKYMEQILKKNLNFIMLYFFSYWIVYYLYSLEFLSIN